MTKNKCPCCSGKEYSICCEKYHQGTLPENALVLMRSRYSAYALGLADYIIETTHPQSPHYISDRTQWVKQIAAFSKQISFDHLEILEFNEGDHESFVSFVAHLSQEKMDVTFSERSHFLKVNNSWKYLEGKIGSGVLTAQQLRLL